MDKKSDRLLAELKRSGLVLELGKIRILDPNRDKTKIEIPITVKWNHDIVNDLYDTILGIAKKKRENVHKSHCDTVCFTNMNLADKDLISLTGVFDSLDQRGICDSHSMGYKAASLFKEFLHGGFPFLPEGIGIGNHHLHAFALEVHEEQVLFLFDSFVGPDGGLFGGLHDQFLFLHGKLFKKGLIDQDPAGLDKVVREGKIILNLIQLKGANLRQVAFRGLGLPFFQRFVEFRKRDRYRFGSQFRMGLYKRRPGKSSSYFLVRIHNLRPSFCDFADDPVVV